MSAVYSVPAKTYRMQIVSDMIAGKTISAATGAASAGQLVIGTSSLSGSIGILATLTLDPVPFTVEGGVATLDCTPPLTVAASDSGTAALAEFRTAAGTTVVSGLTVGTIDADIILSSVSIVASGVVTIFSGTIAHG